MSSNVAVMLLNYFDAAIECILNPTPQNLRKVLRASPIDVLAQAFPPTIDTSDENVSDVEEEVEVHHEEVEIHHEEDEVHHEEVAVIGAAGELEEHDVYDGALAVVQPPGPRRLWRDNTMIVDFHEVSNLSRFFHHRDLRLASSGRAQVNSRRWRSILRA